jgi:hypothetical protein
MVLQSQFTSAHDFGVVLVIASFVLTSVSGQPSHL